MKALALTAGLALVPALAAAQRVEDVPDPLVGVGIEENLDAALPLELMFLDENGDRVALGSFFGDKPVALNLVYFNCPMLCNVFLDGVVTGFSELDWTPGQEFEVVTVSIDPLDTPAGATEKRAHYVERLGRPEAAEGWHFLTGTEENVRRLADAVGFSYRYDENKQEYMHSAALFVATPAGRLSRYLYGVMFEPTTLRLSLVEASDGKIGGAMDQILLFCFAYDHTEGRYGPAAFKIMRAGAALSLVFLGAFLTTLGRRERKRTIELGASN